MSAVYEQVLDDMSALFKFKEQSSRPTKTTCLHHCHLLEHGCSFVLHCCDICYFVLAMEYLVLARLANACISQFAMNDFGVFG